MTMKKGVLKLVTHAEDINIEINQEPADGVETVQEVEEASKELDDTITADDEKQEVIENLMMVRQLIKTHGLNKATLHLLNKDGQLNMVLGTLLPSVEDDGSCCDAAGEPIPESVDLTNIPTEEVIDALDRVIAVHEESLKSGWHYFGGWWCGHVIGLLAVYVYKVYMASAKRASVLKGDIAQTSNVIHGHIDEETFKAHNCKVLAYASWSHGFKAITTAIQQLVAINIEEIAQDKPFNFDPIIIKDGIEACGLRLKENKDSFLGMGTKGTYYTIVSNGFGSGRNSSALGVIGWSGSVLSKHFTEVNTGLDLVGERSKLKQKLDKIQKLNKNLPKKNEDGTKKTPEEKKEIFEAKQSVKLYAKALSVLIRGLNDYAADYAKVCKAARPAPTA